MSNFNVYQIPADATIEQEVPVVDERGLMSSGETRKETIPHPRAGWWTASINGEETMFFSTESQGVWRRMKLLLNGRRKGSVQLKVVEGKAVPLTAEEKAKTPLNYVDLPTVEERIAGFLNRDELKAFREETPPDDRDFAHYREWRRKKGQEVE